MSNYHARGPFHLRDGFYFNRSGDDIVILFRKAGDRLGATEVPVGEWARVVAFTSAKGETDETYKTAVAFLGVVEREPVSDEVIAAIERCPEWRTHGNPFRYCAYCPWTEEIQERVKAQKVTNRDA